MIGKLVAAEMYAIMDKALQVAGPWQAIATYVTDRRDLQYREPAFTDALLMTYPDSGQLAAIAKAVIDMTTSLVQRGHDAGVIRRDFTAEDLYYADVAGRSKSVVLARGRHVGVATGWLFCLLLARRFVGQECHADTRA